MDHTCRRAHPASSGNAALHVLVSDHHRTPVAQALHRHQDVLGHPVAGEPVRLKDESLALVRPVQATDVPLLIDGFARLSLNSRRMRFLAGKNALSAKELKYFTDIDHRDHEALGALDAVTGYGVGVARYIRDTDDVHCAEVAITVVDQWQGRGLGLELMARLARRAQHEGIARFSALVAADNAAVRALLRRMDADVELISYDSGAVQYEIYLRRRSPCESAQAS